MDIRVKVTANAKKNLIKEENGKYKVYLTAPAIEGKANQALREFLAGHFRIKRSQVSIVKGEKLREKIIRIQPSS